MHADPVDDLRQRLAARFRELQRAHGLSGKQIEARTHYDRKNVSAVRNSGRLPARHVLAAYDDLFGCGSELTDLGDRIRAADQAERLRGLSARAAGPNTPTPPEAEAAGADRREFVEFGALTIAAGLAGEVSRRVASADPDPLTLDELDERLDQIGASYTSSPHAALTPLIVGGWRDAERLLERRLSARVRTRVTTMAGLFAFYGGRLAFNLGDDTAARRFASLAELYSRDVDDPLLSGSVATLKTSIAYYTGRHSAAADIAGQARAGAHPYLRARLAAYEARARAAAGQHDQARQALRDMQDTVWLGEPMVGTETFGEELIHCFLAVVSGRLGDGEHAEPHAHRSLAILQATGGGYEDIGGTYNALAQAFLRRARPDPEQAADAASRALAVLDGRPTRTVIQRSGQIWQELGARWENQRAVLDLGEQLQAHRRALPAGSSST
ncbi:DNA-binding protein [Frankia sp. Ag45/Mut15]|uniref:DNA-binding protein n=1 Tax=Frankia umida TaxID=573489 RepID=A0ABT0JYP4_9ACTN|nr:helix-turn-helix domain-containing protein [Frankia umida]MCK9876621.1 DNA-binding protein [Frankia umida]